MVMHAMYLRRVCSCALAGMLAIGAPKDVMSATRAQLTLELERTTFAVGEPVMVLARVENIGSAPLDDIPYIHPLGERLQVHLRKAGEAAEVRRVGLFASLLYTEPGLTLRPGESYCEVINLLEHYGNNPDRQFPMHDALTWFVLPEGSYELGATVTLSTSGEKQREDGVLSAQPLKFRVEKRAYSAEEAALWVAIEDLVWERNRIGGEHARQSADMLAGAVGTRFLWPMYAIGRRHIGDTEALAVMERFRGRAGGHVGRSVFGLLHFAQVDSDLEQFTARVSRAFGNVAHGTEAAARRTLEIKATQRKYVRMRQPSVR